MNVKDLKLRPSTLGIFFGVFLLALSGMAGFYLPSRPTGISGGLSGPTPDALASGAATPVATKASLLLTATPTAEVASTSSVLTGTPASVAKAPVTPVRHPTSVESPTPRPSPAATHPPAPTPSPLPASTATPVPHITYTVREGDTIYDIAARYGVTPDSIVRYNGLSSPDELSIGDEIAIPNSSASAPVGTPAPEQHTKYTVQEGDTLSDIASRYGVTVDSIVRYNGLGSADDLSVGDEITIPLR